MLELRPEATHLYVSAKRFAATGYTLDTNTGSDNSGQRMVGPHQVF